MIDNSKPFFNSLMASLCEKFKFSQHKSSMYNATANGWAEAFNRMLCNVLKKVVSKSKRDWHKRPEKALLAYWTTHKTLTQSTPFSLVYRVEVVLPLKLQFPSFCIVMWEGLTEDDNHKLRLAELEALDENRLKAQQQLECYQAPLPRVLTKRFGHPFFKLDTKGLS